MKFQVNFKIHLENVYEDIMETFKYKINHFATIGGMINPELLLSIQYRIRSFNKLTSQRIPSLQVELIELPGRLSATFSYSNRI